MQLEAIATGAIQLVAIRDRAAAAGIDPDELLAMVEPVPVTNVELGQVAGRSPDDETAAFIMTLVLFGAISTYGAMVLSGVVEEKSSRTVEVLLARMPARNLLAGKIAGIGLLGLAQIAATAVVAVTVGAMVDSVDIPAVRRQRHRLGGGLVPARLRAVRHRVRHPRLARLAHRGRLERHRPGHHRARARVHGLFATIGSADTTWAQLVSWFPLTAPLAMPNRIAMGAASWWDPLLAVVLTLAAIAGLVVLGGRDLHPGHPPHRVDAQPRRRMARRPHADPRRRCDRLHRQEPSTAGATAAASPRKARRAQVILAVVSLALGGVVFAVTADFVIGVAVGAGFFALAVRGIGPGVGDSRRPTWSHSANVNRPVAGCSVAVDEATAAIAAWSEPTTCLTAGAVLGRFGDPLSRHRTVCARGRNDLE